MEPHLVAGLFWYRANVKVSVNVNTVRVMIWTDYRTCHVYLSVLLYNTDPKTMYTENRYGIVVYTPRAI